MRKLEKGELSHWIKLIIVFLIIEGEPTMPQKTTYFSFETEKLVTNITDLTFKEYGEKYEIDPLLLKSIATNESTLFPFAFRYEPQLEKQEWYRSNLTEEEKADPLSYCSYGYMQVLFGVAKGLGFNGTPNELNNPKTNIKYGAKLLKSYIKRYGNVNDALSSYNQGTPKKNDNGQYRNQSYVDKILDTYHKLKIKHSSSNTKP